MTAWVRFWCWLDARNHAHTGKRTDDTYPVLGCPRFYWLCSLADFMTKGIAHD